MKKLLFLLLSIGGLQFANAQSIPQNIILEDLNGAKVNTDTWVDGETPIIITFWATWCKPCQSELEALLELRDKWHGKVRIIAVSVDDSRSASKVRSLVKGRRWPYEVYLDANKSLYKTFNLTTIPFAVVANAKGEIKYSHSGYTPGDEVALVEKALKMIAKTDSK